MKTYYQVCVIFSLSHGKPILENLSLHSTSVYFPFLLMSHNTPLSYSRFFQKVSEAENYINYLFSRHPNSKAKRPVLDASQLILI